MNQSPCDDVKDTVRWVASVLIVLSLIAAVSLFAGCAVPTRHKSPDRADFIAGLGRVERAIPVLRQTQAELKEAVGKVRRGHESTVESFNQQAGIIDALAPAVGRIREIAMRTSISDVELRELRAEIEGLESTVQQLDLARDTLGTMIVSSAADLSRVESAQAAHAKAIDDVVREKNEVVAEGAAIMQAYEEKMGRLNALEVEHAKTKNELTKARIVSGFQKAWAVISGLGVAGLGVLLAVGKLGFR